ncbi:hypothetical protein FFJ24_010275 [Pedobacter sp. KBS0701]|uniref:hypothetical protein n=1 Tax=Pedobacter sp. KBS0701 TaxID=2578106 RepID=UPI00110E7894|nr:hypothetical protein [Pedobacter sp. KBS0701]QDW25174.1 hypothetical protein FFJ24_010275 [Pedobacter sp. KBS0701]
MAENYVKTIETLRLLSSSYEDQVRCFPDFADVPDEVISSFETVFLLIPSLIEEEIFSFKSIASILRIYNKMQWSLRNLDLDDFSSTEWNELRELSKNTLRLLDEVIQKPDMKYI